MSKLVNVPSLMSLCFSEKEYGLSTPLGMGSILLGLCLTSLYFSFLLHEIYR